LRQVPNGQSGTYRPSTRWEDTLMYIGLGTLLIIIILLIILL
jgi:hypothetical protein